MIVRAVTRCLKTIQVGQVSNGKRSILEKYLGHWATQAKHTLIDKNAMNTGVSSVFELDAAKPTGRSWNFQCPQNADGFTCANEGRAIDDLSGTQALPCKNVLPQGCARLLDEVRLLTLSKLKELQGTAMPHVEYCSKANSATHVLS